MAQEHERIESQTMSHGGPAGGQSEQAAEGSGMDRSALRGMSYEEGAAAMSPQADGAKASKKEQDPVVVKSLKGDAEFRFGSGKWFDAFPGLALPAGSRFRTKSDSVAVISFGPEGDLTLRENSLLVLYPPSRKLADRKKRREKTQVIVEKGTAEGGLERLDERAYGKKGKSKGKGKGKD